MLAIGVGGADAVDAMTGTPWELKAPQIVGQYLFLLRVLLFVYGSFLTRYTFNWSAFGMGNNEGFDFASGW